MKGLEYQISQLYTAVGGIDIHHLLPVEIVSDLQLSIARATALARNAATLQQLERLAETPLPQCRIDKSSIDAGQSQRKDGDTTATAPSPSSPTPPPVLKPSAALQQELNRQETLQSVAALLSVSVDRLREWNHQALVHLRDDDVLPPDIFLKVCGKSSTGTAPPPGQLQPNSCGCRCASSTDRASASTQTTLLKMQFAPPPPPLTTFHGVARATKRSPPSWVANTSGGAAADAESAIPMFSPPSSDLGRGSGGYLLVNPHEMMTRSPGELSSRAESWRGSVASQRAEPLVPGSATPSLPPTCAPLPLVAPLVESSAAFDGEPAIRSESVASSLPPSPHAPSTAPAAAALTQRSTCQLQAKGDHDKERRDLGSHGKEQYLSLHGLGLEPPPLLQHQQNGMGVSTSRSSSRLTPSSAMQGEEEEEAEVERDGGGLLSLSLDGQPSTQRDSISTNGQRGGHSPREVGQDGAAAQGFRGDTTIPQRSDSSPPPSPPPMRYSTLSKMALHPSGAAALDSSTTSAMLMAPGAPPVECSATANPTAAPTTSTGLEVRQPELAAALRHPIRTSSVSLSTVSAQSSEGLRSVVLSPSQPSPLTAERQTTVEAKEATPTFSEYEEKRRADRCSAARVAAFNGLYVSAEATGTTCSTPEREVGVAMEVEEEEEPTPSAHVPATLREYVCDPPPSLSGVRGAAALPSHSRLASLSPRTSKPLASRSQTPSKPPLAPGKEGSVSPPSGCRSADVDRATPPSFTRQVSDRDREAEEVTPMEEAVLSDDDRCSDDYDTLAGIASSYNVSVEVIKKWNSYLAAYHPDEPLPPDLPITLPMPSSDEEAELNSHAEDADADDDSSRDRRYKNGSMQPSYHGRMTETSPAPTPPV